MVDIVVVNVIIVLAVVFMSITRDAGNIVANRIVKGTVLFVAMIALLFSIFSHETYSKRFSSSNIYRLKYFFEYGEDYKYAYFDENNRLIEESVPVESYPPGLDKIGPTIVEVFETTTINKKEWGPLYSYSQSREKERFFR